MTSTSTGTSCPSADPIAFPIYLSPLYTGITTETNVFSIKTTSVLSIHKMRVRMICRSLTRISFRYLFFVFGILKSVLLIIIHALGNLFLEKDLYSHKQKLDIQKE